MKKNFGRFVALIILLVLSAGGVARADGGTTVAVNGPKIVSPNSTIVIEVGLAVPVPPDTGPGPDAAGVDYIWVTLSSTAAVSGPAQMPGCEVVLLGMQSMTSSTFRCPAAVTTYYLQVTPTTTGQVSVTASWQGTSDQHTVLVGDLVLDCPETALTGLPVTCTGGLLDPSTTGPLEIEAVGPGITRSQGTCPANGPVAVPDTLWWFQDWGQINWPVTCDVGMTLPQPGEIIVTAGTDVLSRNPLGPISTTITVAEVQSVIFLPELFKTGGVITLPPIP